MSHSPCDACEELLQGYLDRELTDSEVAHRRVAPRRLRLLPAPLPLRVSLRQYVQTTAVERMPVGLMEKLTELRSSRARRDGGDRLQPVAGLPSATARADPPAC